MFDLSVTCLDGQDTNFVHIENAEVRSNREKAIFCQYWLPDKLDTGGSGFEDDVDPFRGEDSFLCLLGFGRHFFCSPG